MRKLKEVEKLAQPGKNTDLGRMTPNLCLRHSAPVGLEVRIQIHFQFRKKPVVFKLPPNNFCLKWYIIKGICV